MIVTADIGINHNGSVGIARALVDVAAACGVDYVKFQKRDVDTCYTEDYLAGPRESPFGTTQRDQKEGIEFAATDYDLIDAYCERAGVGWFLTPFDVPSIQFLQRFDLPYTKIASACLTDDDMLDAARAIGRPVVLSTGMSTREQVDHALAVLGDSCEYLLHCVGTYPTPDVDMNLRRMAALRERYGPGCRVGLSSHSSEPLACFLAAVLGAEMIEFHITLSRQLYGSDQSSSLDESRVTWMMQAINRLRAQEGDGTLAPRDSEQKAMQKLRKAT